MKSVEEGDTGALTLRRAVNLSDDLEDEETEIDIDQMDLKIARGHKKGKQGRKGNGLRGTRRSARIQLLRNKLQCEG